MRFELAREVEDNNAHDDEERRTSDRSERERERGGEVQPASQRPAASGTEEVL